MCIAKGGLATPLLSPLSASLTLHGSSSPKLLERYISPSCPAAECQWTRPEPGWEPNQLKLASVRLGGEAASASCNVSSQASKLLSLVRLLPSLPALLSVRSALWSPEERIFFNHFNSGEMEDIRLQPVALRLPAAPHRSHLHPHPVTVLMGI